MAKPKALEPPPISTTSKPPETDGSPQPTNRLANASMALELITRRAQALQRKWNVWREVEAKYDCEPPDSPDYLKANGLGHVTNVSWGTMEARVDEIVETYYNLAMGGEQFLKFHSRAEGPIAQRLLRIMSEEHKIMWDGWNGRNQLLQTVVHHRSLLPFSLTYYDSPAGWHAKAVHPRNLIYPELAGLDVDQWFWCAIRSSYEAWQLLEKLKDPEASTAVGWKLPAIRKACELFCVESGRALAAMSQSFASVQWEKISQSDLGFNDRIPFFVLYVREWNGKVSEHFLVDHKDVGYIYSSVGKLDNFSDKLQLFTHGVGNGTLDSVRSYGVKTLLHHDAMDRATNAEFDTNLVTNSLILQAQAGTDPDKLSELIFSLGGVTMLPTGLQPAQVKFNDNGAGLRLFRQDLRQQLGRNTPSLAGEVDLGEYQKSNQQAAMIFQTSLQLGLFKVDRFHAEMDAFVTAHWRRLLGCIGEDVKGPGAEDARAFFQFLAAQGVPPELIGGIYRVSHRTGSARGNRVNAQLAMDRSRQYIGFFTEDGKRAFARADITLALDDADQADEWLGPPQRADAESEQARAATLENGTMAGGLAVQAATTDMDKVHMDVHSAFVQQHIEQCERGQLDPAACLRTLTLEIAHVQPHFARLGQDRFAEDAFKGLMQVWSQFENYRRNLETQVQRAAQAHQQRMLEAQRTPQLDPNDVQKINAGQLAMRQDEEKHQQKLRHAQEDHEMKRNIEATKAAQELKHAQVAP